MIEPFLKWAGGKRWLVSRYGHLLPHKFNRYIEPFLGGGAVFFHLAPANALLGDKNGELINAYKIVQTQPNELTKRLERFHQLHSPELYYSTRKANPICNLKRAARFLYLNRVCFNGIYRVNQRGEFNVPLGSKFEVRYTEGYLQKVSDYLQCVLLLESDFEAVIDNATSNDFVFIDPPYTVTHNNNGFIKYNDVLFSWQDQIRLAEAAKRASNRGALIFVSNANHSSVIALYNSFCYQHTLYRNSILSANPSARRLTSEVAFLNYCAPKESFL